VETGDRQWETGEDALLAALDEVLAVLHARPWDAVVMGGIASAIHGRPRWTHDIDLFVRPEHARMLLEALADAGFDTVEEDPYWLFKAFWKGVLVDVIFRSHGDIYLDDEMLARASEQDFRGRQLRVIPPEDLLVIKAIVHAEYSPRHWHDALALLSRCDLDWDYLQRRARHGPRRVLSLLLYAQSNDLPVPAKVIDDLYRRITTS